MSMIRYLESRRRDIGPSGLVSDLVRHFYSRQRLGTALVITDDPEAVKIEAVKQWQRLARTLQNRRAASCSAEEILRLTATVTYMQRLRFAIGLPSDGSEAGLYFVSAEQVRVLPANCLTAYVVTADSTGYIDELIRQLPGRSLIVDYTGVVLEADTVTSRERLEENLSDSWRRVEKFLVSRGVSTECLAESADQSMSASDGALDIILGCIPEFSPLADQFMRSLDLARPLRRATKRTRERYGDLVRLVARVDSLTPGVFSSRTANYDLDDSFALRDHHDTDAADLTPTLQIRSIWYDVVCYE